MNKELLLQTASKISSISEKSIAEYQSKKDGLVETMNQKMEARADIADLIGEVNMEMMKDNHANHARFMESMFSDYSHEVMVDTVLWVFRAYRARNFSSTYWAAQINSWLEIYKTELSAECYKEVEPFYKWMQVNIPIFNKLAEEKIDAPLSAH